VVHACKTPCHQRAVGYSENLRQNHPSYLVKEEENNLYLNMIDANKPGYLKPRFMMPMIEASLIFTEDHLQKGSKVLIHCNMGMSRSPTLAMLFLGKRVHSIDETDFASARGDFMTIYPGYSPGVSITTFLNAYWDDID
jgi:predicted protein tyrosine phosphatase